MTRKVRQLALAGVVAGAALSGFWARPAGAALTSPDPDAVCNDYGCAKADIDCEADPYGVNAPDCDFRSDALLFPIGAPVYVNYRVYWGYNGLPYVSNSGEQIYGSYRCYPYNGECDNKRSKLMTRRRGGYLFCVNAGIEGYAGTEVGACKTWGASSK
jgi:hypothetical protein